MVTGSSPIECSEHLAVAAGEACHVIANSATIALRNIQPSMALAFTLISFFF
jgi:hypothetical protein